jgi:hypothetical protein
VSDSDVLGLSVNTAIDELRGETVLGFRDGLGFQIGECLAGRPDPSGCLPLACRVASLPGRGGPIAGRSARASVNNFLSGR